MRRLVFPLVVLAVGALAVGGFVTARQRAEPTTQLTVAFRVTGQEDSHRYEVVCHGDAPRDATRLRVCTQLSTRQALLLPSSERPACPLPVPALYVTVEGQLRGESVHYILVPCSDAEMLAIDAWVDTLEFAEEPQLLRPTADVRIVPPSEPAGDE